MHVYSYNNNIKKFWCHNLAIVSHMIFNRPASDELAAALSAPCDGALVILYYTLLYQFWEYSEGS
jgi:hypothetical protein